MRSTFSEGKLSSTQYENYSFYPYCINHFTYVEYIDQYYKDVGRL